MYPKNYVIFRNDRTCHGGGVLIIVRDHLKVFCWDDLNQLCDELLLLQISEFTSHFYFGVFYWPPTSSVGKDNVLDIIFTNRSEIIADVEAVDNLPSSDHDAIRFDVNILLPPQGPCNRTLYNYKKADLLLLNETLSRIPWGLIEQCDTIEDARVLFKDLFFGAVDIAVPRQKWRRKKLKHWFCYDTIHLIREKLHLFLNIKSSSPSLISKYKHVSNLVRSKTRMDIKAFSESLC